MLFRRISVRLKKSLPPLDPQRYPDLPAVTPKKWYHFSENLHDRTVRLGIDWHQAHLIDHIKTTLNIKKGSRAAILFHLLSQQGLWEDGALPQIVQFQSTRKAQYPTVESAIPAYVAHRNELTPVTKTWVSLIIGTLPLGPVQRRIESDVWKWIQSATGPQGISQTDLPKFLTTHQEILAQSLHAANTMGRFSDDHATLVHRLVPLIISAFDKAKPDWKQIQAYTPLKNVLKRRNAWLIRDKEKTATDWDQRIGQLSAKTSLSDSEAREYVLRYQTDSAVEHVEIGPKGRRPTELRSIDIFREFLLNHIEKRIIDSFNPSVDVQPIIAAWQEFRNNAVRTLHRSHLIDAPFYDLLTQRTHIYHAAGLASQDGAYAENWIHTHTLYSCRQAETPIDFKMSPTPSIIQHGIEAAILNRSPELTHFLPIWRQSTPDRSIHELETRVQDLYRAGLLVGKESAWGSKEATPSPPAPRLFPPKTTVPPLPDVRPSTPVKFKHGMGNPFDGGLKSGTDFKIRPYPDEETDEDSRPNSPAIPGYTTAENGALFPPHTDIVFWFNRVNPLLDQGYSIDDACRLLVTFPKFTPHPDDCAQLEALYQKISAKNGSPWTVERVVAVGPLFHDLCQEAIFPEATVLPYILELGPEAHAVELRLAQEIKDVPAGQARMITLMAHFRRLSNHADPDLATVKRHALACFRLHFSIRQIVEFEKNLTPDLSETRVHRLVRRLFFNQFSPALITAMENRTHAILADASPHPNPEYLAAEMTLREERTSIYSTQNVSEKWTHIVEGAIGLNYAPPYAITPKDLVLYIKTLSALVTDDQRPRRIVWQRIGITDTGIEWLENRFQTLVDAHDLTQRLILPENYNHSIVDRTPTAFTLALSDYIQHQSDHHQSIYRELGIHPDDMSLLQATLPICTPDESIRAHSDRNLGRSLATLREERYTRLGIDFDKSKSEFVQFAPLRGESKTAHTRRFLDAVQAQAALKLRREVYEMEKISQTEVPYLEEIGRTAFSGIMVSDPKRAAYRAIKSYCKFKLASDSYIYSDGDCWQINSIYDGLEGNYPTLEKKFQEALKRFSVKTNEEQKKIQEEQDRRDIACIFSSNEIWDHDIIRRIQARWLKLPGKEQIEQCRGYMDRRRHYNLHSIPESDHLKLDTNHWKEGLTGKDVLIIYTRHQQYQALGCSSHDVDKHWKPGMTPEATVAAYKAELKKQQEAAEVARVAQVARVAALQREKETAEIARLEAAWPMAFTKPSPSDIIPNYASSPTVYTAPSPVYTYTRPEYDFLAEFNSENRRREQEAQTLRFFEEGRRATYGGWM